MANGCVLQARGAPASTAGATATCYLNIRLLPHKLFRVTGRDLYLDLPLAPWEAVLGTTVEIPTLGGPVRLRVRPTPGRTAAPPCARGLPKPGHEGDLVCDRADRRAARVERRGAGALQAAR